MKSEIKYTLQGKVRLFVKENDKIIKDISDDIYHMCNEDKKIVDLC